MRITGRRPADPPFPAAVRLLGRLRPITADRRTPHAERRRVLAALMGAVAKLEAEAAAGLLSAEDRRFLGALAGFTVGRGRSGQWRGVFIFGLADVKASSDPGYWSSALVHDGVHAWRQVRGRPFMDEVGPCDAQIDYMTRTGGDASFIASVAAFRDSRARQRVRWREEA